MGRQPHRSSVSNLVATGKGGWSKYIARGGGTQRPSEPPIRAAKYSAYLEAAHEIVELRCTGHDICGRLRGIQPGDKPFLWELWRQLVTSCSNRGVRCVPGADAAPHSHARLGRQAPGSTCAGHQTGCGVQARQRGERKAQDLTPSKTCTSAAAADTVTAPRFNRSAAASDVVTLPIRTRATCRAGRAGQRAR